MPYCQHCGSPHPDDAQFCPQCGSWVASVGSLPAATVATARYAGFWPRLGGWLIDQIIIAIPFNIVSDLLVSYNQPTVTTTTDASNNIHIHITDGNQQNPCMHALQIHGTCTWTAECPDFLYCCPVYVACCLFVRILVFLLCETWTVNGSQYS